PGLILAGDAARLIDPLTGGGILNGCLSGKYAGEVAADAVSAGKATDEALSSYEKRWRARLEDELARHYLIKDRLIRLDDETSKRVFGVAPSANSPSYKAKGSRDHFTIRSSSSSERRSDLLRTLTKGRPCRNWTVALSRTEETNPEADFTNAGSFRYTRAESSRPKASIRTGPEARNVNSSI